MTLWVVTRDLNQGHRHIRFEGLSPEELANIRAAYFGALFWVEVKR